ncbi:Actin-related protein 9 [Linum perenne]
MAQDYLKTVVPSQLIAERGSNIVVINPGSANVRIGAAQQDAPYSIPHCIARHTNQTPKLNVQDQVMLNCQVTNSQHMDREQAYNAEGELEVVCIVHSYEDGLAPGSHKTRLSALNVAPMGLFYPTLLVPDVYPPPPRSWFNDYDDMLEETWHIEYPRRPDISDSMYPGMNVGLPMWDNYPIFASKPKKEEKVGLAEAITGSILSSGKTHIMILLSFAFCLIDTCEFTYVFFFTLMLFDTPILMSYVDRPDRASEEVVL